jgi:hypothetical protein
MSRGVPRTVVTIVVGVAWLAGAGAAMATVPIQKKAKEAGYPATSCVYCHNEKLPKKDAATFNARGTWLRAERDKRKVKDVDPAWLKDYVEKK